MAFAALVDRLIGDGLPAGTLLILLLAAAANGGLAPDDSFPFLGPGGRPGFLLTVEPVVVGGSTVSGG